MTVRPGLGLRDAAAALPVATPCPYSADMATGKRAPTQDDLFSSGSRSGGLQYGLDWPDRTRFPLNIRGERAANVRSVVWPDLLQSEQPTIVAGFASIGRIIDFVAAWTRRPSDSGQVRLLLGSEPFGTSRSSFSSTRVQFTAAARRYWIEERHVDLRQSADLIAVIQALREGRLSCRFLPGLHAKIFTGDDAATLGSSNFTAAGLESQVEATARFSADNDRRRFRELVAIADNYWRSADHWNDELRELLESLLRVVSWQAALGRACAELLEGEWAARYLDAAGSDLTLWPSQRAGIAQALWTVRQVGSVLVADATGSGKTRMGAQLVRAVRDQMWSTGRARRDLTVLVGPPAITNVWREEAVRCGLSLEVVSHGRLSSPGLESSHLRAVERAEILAVDEAHNFLNPNSERTRRLRSSGADHVVLFTATPISRGATDLLQLVSLLGPDNFEDETLDVLARLERRRSDVLRPDEAAQLREEIHRFTLRRTKSQLNELVDREPDEYLHPVTGRVCRFPQQSVELYATGETPSDSRAADRIRELASQLRGLGLLPTKLASQPPSRKFVTDDVWLQQRLASARGLSIHHVLNSMRSSRAALLEHLLGTLEATKLFGLPAFKPDPTGDVVGKVEQKAAVGPPEIELECELPPWLTDSDEWVTACEAEVLTYRGMVEAVGDLSGSREDAKCRLLIELLSEHPRLLAFDSHLITLTVMKRSIETARDDIPVHIATGSDPGGRRRVMREFAPEADARGIALCSDAMNEGLNLQGASAIVHLDLPTTLRVAEQRVGRVDRMDSRHDRIAVWWPNDGQSFATGATELLVARADEAERLIGSNLQLPRFDPALDKAVDIQEIAKRAAQEIEPWDHLRDAFESVRALVVGEDALVPAETYAEYRTVTERVVARVAPVAAQQPWAFFAVRAGENEAPRWMLLAREHPAATDLDGVAVRLRELLGDDPLTVQLDGTAMEHLVSFLGQAAEVEVALLPRRLRRALEQMATVVAAWRELALRDGDWGVADRWDALGQLCSQAARGDPDPRAVAEGWLKLVAPVLADHRAGRRRSTLVLLRDITRRLCLEPLELATVEAQFRDVPSVAPFGERVSSCILGVPQL